MLITCLRHATAEPHDSPGTDAERALVKKGRMQMERVIYFCRKNGLTPAALYSSPLKRAWQSALMLQTQLTDCPDAIAVDWLSMGRSTGNIIEALAKLQQAGINDVWLIGHEPDLSSLMANLLAAPQASFNIKKASLTRLDLSGFQPGDGCLLWSIPCALMH